MEMKVRAQVFCDGTLIAEFEWPDHASEFAWGMSDHNDSTYSVVTMLSSTVFHKGRLIERTRN